MVEGSCPGLLHCCNIDKKVKKKILWDWEELDRSGGEFWPPVLPCEDSVK